VNGEEVADNEDSVIETEAVNAMEEIKIKTVKSWKESLLSIKSSFKKRVLKEGEKGE
jgi:hypothetical protein